jgi:GWxTD domain-containing protein
VPYLNFGKSAPYRTAMTHRSPIPGLAAAALLLGAAAAACGSAQRAGPDSAPDPEVVVPRLFDPTSVYQDLGFLAHGSPLPFVAVVRFLATSSPDTAFAVVGLSLANDALSFRRIGQGFEAAYRVEIALSRDGQVVRRIASDELVRVGSRVETRRVDECVVFQQILRVPVGLFDVTISVRDEYSGTFSRAEQQLQVPDFDIRALSSLLTLYHGKVRANLDSVPRFVLNPRATVPYGLDTLRLYVESYGQTTGGILVFTALSERGEVVWSTRVAIDSSSGLNSTIVSVAPDLLPVGAINLVATREGTADSVTASALVSFSDRWAVVNLDEVLSLLRHFGHDTDVAALRDAPASERAALWRKFWRETDPNPTTHENEALEEYFQRLREANRRFLEAGDPGWLTDRGEVFIILGEPDEVFEQTPGFEAQRRIIRWRYVRERITIDFIDETGFGRFRLTPTSRSEFMQAARRVRSGS